MYRQIVLLLGAVLLGLAHAQHAPITAPPRPRSTAVPRRIVKRTIELRQNYGAPIGVDTDYLTMEGSSTKWIGVDMAYLTEETYTSTIDNVETTTVVKPQLAAVTATAASEGVEVGDVTVLMSDAVQDALDALIKDAVASCGAGARLRKRDPMSCMVNAIQGAAQNGETIGLINPAEWDGFALELAGNAPDILGAAFSVLKTQAEKNKFALMVAAAGTAGAFAAEPIVEVAHKFIFSDGLFGHPADDSDGGNGGNDEDDVQPTEQSTASPSTSACDPSATVDENSPACDDPDCKGEERICQADGEKKDCRCVEWVQKMVEGLFDREWADEQQKILQELEAGLPDVIPPQCFRNTHGDGFDGKPRAEPSAFCRCSSIGSEGAKTEGNFATMSGDGDEACTYTTMPTETISITAKPTETEITSCRMESSHGLDPYCTCNDDSIHGEIVTKYLGKETTVCPDAKATMTVIPSGTPIAPHTCYPGHGYPHMSPNQDALILLCRADKPEFAAVCRSGMSDERGVEVGCPGQENRGATLPIMNNRYFAWFKKADDAPDDCNYLFKQDDFADDDDMAIRVDALCIPMFETIRTMCPWTGGEIQNQCGTFIYQSCPKSTPKCKWGSPQG